MQKNFISKRFYKGKRLYKGVGILGAGIILASNPVLAEPHEDSFCQCSAVADVNTCLNIREGAGTENAVIGQLPKYGLCYVERTEGDWSYIISGDIRGYVFNEYLTVADLENYTYEELTGYSEPVLAYAADEAQTTFAVAMSDFRTSIVDYALQFVGNPYVWGGTSLTEGADCSGYVQSIYRDYGISIPRIAQDQANAGNRIPVEEALPGDLIFYAENGSIYHVVMYIGDGQVVHASSSSTGIKVSNVYWDHAVWAARFFE